MEKENSLAFAFMSMLSLAGMGLYVYNNSTDNERKHQDGFELEEGEESDDESLGSEESDDESDDESDEEQPKKKTTRKKNKK